MVQILLVYLHWQSSIKFFFDVRLSLEFMSFRIGNKYYEQADGLFIESPASSCFAELFIQRVEEVSVYTMLHAPGIWIRKVDDTFTINYHETNDTLTELNQIHP